jgi:single-strand DNA-binding protein
LKKGDPILIEGRLQFRTWEAQDGTKRNKVDVVADTFQFLGGRSDGGEGGAPGGGGGGQSSRSGARSQDDPGLNEEDFDDIPF